MDQAIDVRRNKKVYASDVDPVNGRHCTYICPACFEDVYLKAGEHNKPHFSHYEKDPLSAYCPIRTESSGYYTSTTNYYIEKTYFPLYLFQKSKTSYGLKTIFKSLPETYAKLNNNKIRIGKSNNRIRIGRLIGAPYSFEHTSIPNTMDSILNSEGNKDVHDMLNRWGRFIDVILTDGSFFNIRTKRKLRYNEVVHPGESYYLVIPNTKHNSLPNVWINKQPMGNVINNYYSLYEVTIPTSPKNEVINYVSKCRLSISDKIIEPDIVWPPCYERDSIKIVPAHSVENTYVMCKREISDIWVDGDRVTGHINSGRNEIISLPTKEPVFNILSEQGNTITCSLINKDRDETQIHKNNKINILDAINEEKVSAITGADLILTADTATIIKIWPNKKAIHSYLQSSEQRTTLPQNVQRIQVCNSHYNTLIDIYKSANSKNNTAECEKISRSDMLNRDRIPVKYGMRFYKNNKLDKITSRMLNLSSTDGTVSRRIIRKINHGE